MTEVNVAALRADRPAAARDAGTAPRGDEVASTAAFQPGPNSAVYYARSLRADHFTEALAEEVRGSGVGCPAWPGSDTPGSRRKRRGAPAVPAGRDGRRRVARAGHVACGGARPWSFPACATAPWRSPCACPRGSCRQDLRLVASIDPARRFAALRPRPAATNRHGRARAGPARIPALVRFTPRHAIQPSPRARRTLPPLWVRHEAHCCIARVAGMDWRRCLWI